MLRSCCEICSHLQEVIFSSLRKGGMAQVGRRKTAVDGGFMPEIEQARWALHIHMYLGCVHLTTHTDAVAAFEDLPRTNFHVCFACIVYALAYLSALPIRQHRNHVYLQGAHGPPTYSLVPLLSHPDPITPPYPPTAKHSCFFPKSRSAEPKCVLLSRLARS